MSGYDDVELPAETAPLAEKLAAAMRRAGVSSVNELARRIKRPNSASNIGKMLNGRTHRITRTIRELLEQELGTPPGYLSSGPAAVRLEEVAEVVDRLSTEGAGRIEDLQAQLDDLERRVAILEGGGSASSGRGGNG